MPISVARNFSIEAGTGPRFRVRQVARPSPRGLQREPVGILVDDFGLHRFIGADGTRAAAADMAPGWKWC